MSPSPSLSLSFSLSLLYLLITHTHTHTHTDTYIYRHGNSVPVRFSLCLPLPLLCLPLSVSFMSPCDSVTAEGASDSLFEGWRPLFLSLLLSLPSFCLPISISFMSLCFPISLAIFPSLPIPLSCSTFLCLSSLATLFYLWLAPLFVQSIFTWLRLDGHYTGMSHFADLSRILNFCFPFVCVCVCIHICFYTYIWYSHDILMILSF